MKLSFWSFSNVSDWRWVYQDSRGLRCSNHLQRHRLDQAKVPGSPQSRSWGRLSSRYFVGKFWNVIFFSKITEVDCLLGIFSCEVLNVIFFNKNYRGRFSCLSSRYFYLGSFKFNFLKQNYRGRLYRRYFVEKFQI